MIKTKGYEIHETPYEESKPREKKERGGFCSSHKCLYEAHGADYDNSAIKPILKTTNRFLDVCPDCGNYLLWDVISDRARHHRRGWSKKEKT